MQRHLWPYLSTACSPEARLASDADRTHERLLQLLFEFTTAAQSSPSLGNVQAASHAAKLASDAASSAELARQIEELQLPLTTKQPVKDAAAGAVAAGIEAATEPPRLTLQQLQQACHVLVDQQDSCIYGAHINLRAETAVGVPHRLLTAGELRELQAALQHSAAALLELGPGSPKAVCMATVAQDTCVPSDAPSGHYAAQARGFLRAFNLVRDTMEQGHCLHDLAFAARANTRLCSSPAVRSCLAPCRPAIRAATFGWRSAPPAPCLLRCGPTCCPNSTQAQLSCTCWTRRQQPTSWPSQPWVAARRWVWLPCVKAARTPAQSSHACPCQDAVKGITRRLVRRRFCPTCGLLCWSQ